MTAWTTDGWATTGVDWCSKAGIAASTGDYSATTLLTAMKKMDWFHYEVDPDWRGFCEFGPDDIGGVWEKLGVIRKRNPYLPRGTVMFSKYRVGSWGDT